jgi:hypothetical protein
MPIRIFDKELYASTAPPTSQNRPAVAQGLANMGSRRFDAGGHCDIRFVLGRFTAVAGRRDFVLLKTTG